MSLALSIGWPARTSERRSFLVLFLDISKEKLDKYKKFLEKEEINYIYCPFPDGQNVKGEGHPNKIAHLKVSECLSKNF